MALVIGIPLIILDLHNLSQNIINIVLTAIQKTVGILHKVEKFLSESEILSSLGFNHGRPSLRTTMSYESMLTEDILGWVVPLFFVPCYFSMIMANLMIPNFYCKSRKRAQRFWKYLDDIIFPDTVFSDQKKTAVSFMRMELRRIEEMSSQTFGQFQEVLSARFGARDQVESLLREIREALRLDDSSFIDAQNHAVADSDNLHAKAIAVQILEDREKLRKLVQARIEHPEGSTIFGDDDHQSPLLDEDRVRVTVDTDPDGFWSLQFRTRVFRPSESSAGVLPRADSFERLTVQVQDIGNKYVVPAYKTETIAKNSFGCFEARPHAGFRPIFVYPLASDSDSYRLIQSSCQLSNQIDRPLAWFFGKLYDPSMETEEANVMVLERAQLETILKNILERIEKQMLVRLFCNERMEKQMIINHFRKRFFSKLQLRIWLRMLTEKRFQKSARNAGEKLRDLIKIKLDSLENTHDFNPANDDEKDKLIMLNHFRSDVELQMRLPPRPESADDPERSGVMFQKLTIRIWKNSAGDPENDTNESRELPEVLNMAYKRETIYENSQESDGFSPVMHGVTWHPMTGNHCHRITAASWQSLVQSCAKLDST